MFSAILYQLQNTGVCNANSNQLRQMVVDSLEANAALYRDFLCQLILQTQRSPQLKMST